MICSVEATALYGRSSGFDGVTNASRLRVAASAF